MAGANPIDNSQDELIIELNKAYRAVGLYPSGHPALANTFTRTYNFLRKFMVGIEQISLMTTRNGFVRDGKPIHADNQSLVAFAKEMFRRRMKKVFILPDITAAELETFFSLLIVEPEHLHAQGGVEAILVRKKVRGIWANEIHFERIVEEEEEEEEFEEELEYEEQEADWDVDDLNEEQRRLYEIKNKIEQESNAEQFISLLKISSEITRQFIERQQYEDVYFFLGYLGWLPHKGSIPADWCDYAGKALASVISRPTVVYLLDRLSYGKAEDIRTVPVILKTLGAPVTAPLMISWLIEQKDIRRRQVVIDSIKSLGNEAIAVIEPMLRDSRTEVIKIMAALLGKIGSDRAIALLKRLVEYHDRAIVEAAVDALGQIRSTGAYAILTRLLPKVDRKMGEMIILNFGKLKDPINVEALQKIVTGRIDLPKLKRASILALAQIGGEQSKPILLEVLTSEKRFSSEKNRALRTAAAEALGAVADETALTALARWAEEAGDAAVQSACWKAIAVIDARYGVSAAEAT